MLNNSSVLEILLVDDDKVMTRLHKDLLCKMGLDQPPVLCENGLQALNYILENDLYKKQFLVFLDLNMPVLDGWNFLKKLKNLDLLSPVNVVIVTSSNNQRDFKKSQKYERVLYYCQKPMYLECVKKIMNLEPLKPFFVTYAKT